MVHFRERELEVVRAMCCLSNNDDLLKHVFDGRLSGLTLWSSYAYKMQSKCDSIFELYSELLDILGRMARVL